MKMEKLFWKDPYLRKCKARVVEIEGNKVLLDKTIFFAFSGGQESDSGTIGNLAVAEAVKDGNNIYYILSQDPPFKKGDSVLVEIDWDKRFTLMRLHSAAHIVYKVFADATGLKKLIGSNISHSKARLDYESSQNISSFLPETEEKVNQVITENHAINTFDDPNMPGRRIWQLDDSEEWKMYCGGTHPKTTMEIGRIALKRKNIGSGKERIEITLAE